MSDKSDFKDGAFGVESNGQSAHWRLSNVPIEEACMKKDKKLTLSKETLRTLDERDLSLVVGGDSGGHEPPRGGPNSCPNTKAPGCS
jgi:natural product precursor